MLDLSVKRAARMASIALSIAMIGALSSAAERA
jgi:hypothetical protein